ncbi:MAG: FKBP-type peptidyl-prolyl cis-trans isomerase [Chitinophagales bacterium]|nr:FKBP-type peptidyl-prolyl cis-trans isomerase [Chitinophagales bacterium]
MKKITTAFIALQIIMLSLTSCAQKKVTDGFTKTPKGLWYNIYKDAKKPKAKEGSVLKMNIVYMTQKDSVLFSTYEGEQGPIQFTCIPGTFNGDPMEGFTMLGEGDSAMFLMPADSAFKTQEYPPFAKPGDFIKISVAVLSVMSKEEYEAKQSAEAKSQTDMESKTIEEYLAKNNIKAQRTASGIYYAIEKQGDGAKAETGKNVSVNYTGRLLDGTEFDSSLKPGGEPLTFVPGQGRMIKGWEEGIPLFNAGGKGTLYIPSVLGWGSRGSGPKIPPNAITVFDVEIVDVK